MQAAIKAIAYHLPERILTNEQLAAEFPDWTVSKIEEKTGIAERHVAAATECASDLGIAAARKLFDTGVCSPQDVGFLLMCTQSPDYALPTTACIMQDALGIPTTAGALDFNLGCSGFVYGLAMAKGLIETRQARRVLLITAETYSKFVHPGDRSVRTIFGDGAAATLFEARDADGDAPAWIGPFVFGTDGSGAQNLIVPAGGLRCPRSEATGRATMDEQGNWRSAENLYMNGAEIFAFTLRAVPKTVKELLSRSGKNLEEVDLFVFHQANQYMLDHLRNRLKIPDSKFYIMLKHCGNTVSATIPIALKQAADEGRLHPGDHVMVVGFGVGYFVGRGNAAMVPNKPADDP